jgi:integrase
MATIRKRGNRYHVQIRRKGHPAISKSFSSKKTSETFAKDTESRMERGVFQDACLAEQTTLADLLDRYEDEVLPTKKGSYKEQRRLTLLKRELGAYTLAQIQPFLVSKYLRTRLQSVKPVTARRELSILSHALGLAEKDFGIYLPHGNPVSRITLPNIPKGRERRISPEEERCMLDALANNPVMQRLISFAIETGMRRGELANMRWDHMNWKVRTLQIPETKTDIPRTIPLSRKATEALKELPRRLDGIVWGLRPDSITQAFKRACKRAGIENLRFHDLRHEATSRFFEKGLNTMEVSSITGHQDLRMLKRYTHIRAESLVNRL